MTKKDDFIIKSVNIEDDDVVEDVVEDVVKVKKGKEKKPFQFTEKRRLALAKGRLKRMENIKKKEHNSMK